MEKCKQMVKHKYTFTILISSWRCKSPDCRPILVRVHPLHRHRKTRQVHLQVQQQSEVAIQHQETGANHQKLKTINIKRDNNWDSEGRLKDLPEWLEELQTIDGRKEEGQTSSSLPKVKDQADLHSSNSRGGSPDKRVRIPCVWRSKMQ